MMDLALEAWVAAEIERARLAWILGGGQMWQPGERLKLLFAGYNGTRNTGSDVRVEEMLRQVRRVLGAENVALPRRSVCPISSRRSCTARCAATTAFWPAKARCSRASLRTR